MKDSEEVKIDVSLVDQLGSRLSMLAQEQVAAREPIERRWLEDIRQFQGKYAVEQREKPDQALNGNAIYSDAFVNQTRHKTNAGESILGDLLFPNDQKNWGIENTPVPELDKDLESDEVMEVDGAPVTMQDDDGQERQVTKGDVAKRAVEIAQEKAEKMEKTIEDQFIECDYNGHAREAIHWSAMVGTGILKGPIVESTQRKKWSAESNGQWTPVMVDERVASAKHVSPFHIFPDMTAARMDEVEYFFEVSYPNRRQVQDLINSPGIMPEQLIKVLETGPQKRHLTSTQYQEELRAISGLTTVTNNNRFEMWSYRGALSEDLLKEVGLLDSNSEPDPLNEQYGVVWFIGFTVVKIRLNPDGFEPFPYYFYSWEKDHSSIFGYGVPYLMRQSQRVINVAWRQMLDNSSNTAGPQIVIDKSLIEPENGEWEIVPFKIWNKKRAMSTVNDAFGVFSFNNHQSEIQAIYNLAQEIADQESGIPKLQQGQQGKQQTLGEASMQQNNANNDTRRKVREWDDYITKPLLTQFYDWNMRYNKNDEIKGDFKVKATGSSTLLAREQNQQALIQVTTQLMPLPQFAPFFKTETMLKKLIQSFHMDDKGLIRTPEEVQKIQEQQQQDEQGEEQEGNSSESDQFKLQVAQMDAQIKQQQMQLEQMKMESTERLELMKLAQSKEMTLEQLDAKLKEVRMRSTVDLHKFNTEVKVKMKLGEGI